MNIKTLSYVDFEDIQKFICNELNIEYDDFRDYHKIIGGDYKDIWHVWLSLCFDEVENGSYIPVYLDSILEDGLEDLVAQYGDWIMCLKAPIEKLKSILGDEIVVYYYW